MRILPKVMNKTNLKIKKKMRRMNKKVKIKSNEGISFYFIVLTVYIFTKSFFYESLLILNDLNNERQMIE